MTSLRHNGSPEREPRDAYLDTARECILDVGWRRTTLTEIARRAGVSRMTIYRAWSDMQQLLGDLMTREWGTVVAAAVAAGESHADPVQRLVEGIVGTVRALRENELFLRIIELDPELLLPYLLSRRGRSQDAILALTDQQIRDGQEAGDDPRRQPHRDGACPAPDHARVRALRAHDGRRRRHRGRARRRAAAVPRPGARAMTGVSGGRGLVPNRKQFHRKHAVSDQSTPLNDPATRTARPPRRPRAMTGPATRITPAWPTRRPTSTWS